MTIKLEVGRTYSDDEWEQVRDDLLPGDQWIVADRFEWGEDAVRLVALRESRTVTHLTPRTPALEGKR